MESARKRGLVGHSGLILLATGYEAL